MGKKKKIYKQEEYSSTKVVNENIQDSEIKNEIIDNSETVNIKGNKIEIKETTINIEIK